MTTIKQLIKTLEAQAEKYGEDTPIVIFDELTAETGYDYVEENLWLPVSTYYHTYIKALVVQGKWPEEEEEEDY